jgi:hypothetical protein
MYGPLSLKTLKIRYELEPAEVETEDEDRVRGRMTAISFWSIRKEPET